MATPVLSLDKASRKLCFLPVYNDASQFLIASGTPSADGRASVGGSGGHESGVKHDGEGQKAKGRRELRIRRHIAHAANSKNPSGWTWDWTTSRKHSANSHDKHMLLEHHARLQLRGPTAAEAPSGDFSPDPWPHVSSVPPRPSFLQEKWR
nr:unnamed protein product [Digitaria exilis]